MGSSVLSLRMATRAVFFGQFYFCQPRHIQDKAAVDAQESLGRELLLELAERCSFK